MSINDPKIQVFGSGCPSCKRLHERTIQAVKELGLDTEVGYVTDIQRLMALGVMQSPVLAVDGKPVVVGFVPDVEDIKKAISVSGEQQSGAGCKCGGKC